MEILKKLKVIYSLLDKGTRWVFLVGVSFLAVASLLEIVGIGLIFPIVQLLTIDDVSANGEILTFVAKSLNITKPIDLATLGLISLVLLLTIKACLSLFNIYWLNKNIIKSEYAFSTKLYGAILDASMSWHNKTDTAVTLRRLNTSCASIFSSSLLLIAQFVTDLILSLGMFLALFFISPVPALTSLLIGVIGVLLINNVLGRKTLSLAEDYFEIDRTEQKLLLESMRGIQDIKLIAKEKVFLHQFYNFRILKAPFSYLLNTFSQTPRFVFEVLAGIYLLIIFLYLVAFNEPKDIVPILALYAVAAIRFLPALARMASQINNFRKNYPGIEEIKALMIDLGDWTNKDLPSKISAHIPPVPTKPKKSITLKNVTFGYASKASVVSNINMEITIGQSIGIVGHSGSGKSTIIGLLLGFYKPTKGTILIDGVPLDSSKSAFEHSIGLVPQDVFITDSSIRENVAFGQNPEDINDDRINLALKDANLLEFIRSLPEGLDTEVGERGIRLSGGQRQRLGIARTLFYEPEILILDEATSSLDVETESQITEVMINLKHQKTLIIIAHRLSTIQHCDRIFYLQDSSIQAEGTFKQLFDNNESFKKLVEFGQLSV